MKSAYLINEINSIGFAEEMVSFFMVGLGRPSKIRSLHPNLCAKSATCFSLKGGCKLNCVSKE